MYAEFEDEGIQGRRRECNNVVVVVKTVCWVTIILFHVPLKLSQAALIIKVADTMKKMSDECLGQAKVSLCTSHGIANYDQLSAV